MDRNDISPPTLNFGSPVGATFYSPSKRSCDASPNESPIKGTALFGYLNEPSTTMEPPKMPTAPRKTKLGDFSQKNPDDLIGSKTQQREYPFVPATYSVDLTHIAPLDDIKKPMSQFFKKLKKASSISPTTTSIPSTQEPTKNGSFFGFSPSSDGSHAIKTATVGSDGVGTLDKKRFAKVINDTVICNDSPQCASVSSFLIDHTQKENKADVSIVQELCDPLQIGNALPFLLCVISLLKWLIPKGFYPTDLKRDNFGKDKDGNVKWFDFDLKEFVSTKACSFIKSGEFQHDGNPMFQQFLLMLMDFYRQIDENRKSEFAKLNKQTGLLKSLGLLSSEKSVSETTIEDFREVLRNIGLSEEDIAYLVGLITPPASSQ